MIIKNIHDNLFIILNENMYHIYNVYTFIILK